MPYNKPTRVCIRSATNTSHIITITMTMTMTIKNQNNNNNNNNNNVIQSLCDLKTPKEVLNCNFLMIILHIS